MDPVGTDVLLTTLNRGFAAGRDEDGLSCWEAVGASCAAKLLPLRPLRSLVALPRPRACVAYFCISLDNIQMRYIPEPVKLQLRQEAGFGCCGCGSPILQYHHIIPWADEEHNRPEDMMALCPGCHDKCTKKAVTEPEQREWKAHPFNIAKGYVDGLLTVTQPTCIVSLGTCTAGGPSVLFSINGTSLLELTVLNGRLAISLTLYGPKNVLLAEIVDNEWIAGDPSTWDIMADYQKLKIRLKSGDVRLDIDATQTPMRLKAKLAKDGKLLVIRPTGVRSFGGSSGHLNMNQTALYNAGFNFDTTQGNISISGGIIHINADPKARIEWLLDQMLQANTLEPETT